MLCFSFDNYLQLKRSSTETKSKIVDAAAVHLHPPLDCHIAYVFASPLVGFDGKQWVPVPRIGVDDEKARLVVALNAAERKVNMCSAVGTTDNVSMLVGRGCRVLHYTGHGVGDKHSLAFEVGVDSVCESWFQCLRAGQRLQTACAHPRESPKYAGKAHSVGVSCRV